MEALTPGSAGDLPPLGELIADVPLWRHPCASGPFFSSSSSRARCCGLSRLHGTGPFDLSASAPPSRQVLSYRRTDPSVTRRSCAISLIVSPRANRPAAPGRCCSAGVCPPRCAYRISSHTPATSRRHDTSTASSPWLRQGPPEPGPPPQLHTRGLHGLRHLIQTASPGSKLRETPRIAEMSALLARIPMSCLAYSLTVHLTLLAIAHSIFYRSDRKSDRCSYAHVEARR